MKVIYQKFKADPEYKTLPNGNKKLVSKEIRKDKPITKPKTCSDREWARIENLAISDYEILHKLGECKDGEEKKFIEGLGKKSPTKAAPPVNEEVKK